MRSLMVGGPLHGSTLVLQDDATQWRVQRYEDLSSVFLQSSSSDPLPTHRMGLYRRSLPLRGPRRSDEWAFLMPDCIFTWEGY
jgi:hypothetical protein